MVSTLVLLALTGGAYLRLRTQIEKDGEAVLRSNMQEVREILVERLSEHKDNMGVSLSDDTGERVYFYALSDAKVVSRSLVNPISLALIEQEAKPGSFSVFRQNQRSYRTYQFNATIYKQKYKVYLYHSISQEQSILHRIGQMLLAVLGFGVLIAVGINLWLAGQALEPARRTWSAQQQMLLEISHELQTPLATIAALLSARDWTVERRGAALREVGHASDMVKDLIYLSKLRSELPQEESEPVAVSDLTEEVSERFTELARAAGIRLTGHAQPGVFVQTTAERWSRLVSTLLKNVVDHALPNSEASWTLTTSAEHAVFAIQNRTRHKEGAPGGSPSRGREGAGIGLLVASRLVEDMHGTFVTRMEDGILTTEVRVPKLPDMV